QRNLEIKALKESQRNVFKEEKSKLINQANDEIEKIKSTWKEKRKALKESLMKDENQTAFLEYMNAKIALMPKKEEL
ncbi:hypothetical protein JN00_0385, partial [Metamycoplasma subdolum]